MEIWRWPPMAKTSKQPGGAAGEAIRVNLEAYREAGQHVTGHLGNPEFRDLLSAYVNRRLIPDPGERLSCLPGDGGIITPCRRAQMPLRPRLIPFRRQHHPQAQMNAPQLRLQR